MVSIPLSLRMWPLQKTLTVSEELYGESRSYTFIPPEREVTEAMEMDLGTDRGAKQSQDSFQRLGFIVQFCFFNLNEMP